MTMHLFVSDRALIDSSKSLINLETTPLRVGFLDRVTIESFVEPVEVLDPRDTRLEILYRSEVIDIVNPEDYLEDLLNNVYEEGAIYLLNNAGETVTIAQYPDLDTVSLFASDPVLTDPAIIDRRREFKLTLDQLKLTQEEQDVWDALSPQEISKILNIAEYITYGTISTDSAVDVNAVLVGSTDFSGYLNQSISIVNRRTIAKIYDLGIHRSVPRQASFKFVAGGTTLTFVIWLDRYEFKDHYPLSTIINIVPPLELATLIDPTSLTDPIEAAAISRGFSDGMLSPEIQDRDQSGMKVFTTRYIYQSSTYQLSFGIVYRGRIPDDLEIRLRLADYLVDSGYGSRAVWAQRFPDLFIDNIFYLIPMYDQKVALTNADIYPSIIDVPSVIQRSDAIALTIPNASANFELMTLAWDKLFIAVKSDSVNEIPTLLGLHNTYRDFSTTDPGFIEMSSFDRQWSMKINQVVAKAAGEENSVQAAVILVGGHEWYSLIYEGSAYNVIKKASYLQAVAE